MRDIKSVVNAAVALPAQKISAAGSVSGGLVDLSGYKSAMAVIFTGNDFADGSYAVSIQEGDAADGSDLAAVASDYLLADAAGGVAAAKNAVSRVGYLGEKRYIKVTVAASAVASGSTVGVLVLQGDPLNAPV